MGELNIYGVYVPILLVQCVLAYVVLRVVMIGTDRLIEKGWIPLPSVFYLCLYIILLWLIHWGFIVSFV
jgi:hypothetical protein